MIPTPTLYSLALAAFVDNLAALPRGYFAKLAVTVTHMFGNNQIVILLYLYPVDIFCEIGLNSDRCVLTSLRSPLHTGIIFLFFEYILAKFVISAPGWSLSIVFCLIEIEDDLAVNAGCRHSRGSYGLFFGLFLLFCIFCYHSLLGEWSAVQLPA